MTWSYETLGWLAALSVVLQACSPFMLPLRIFAACSNILFVAYAHHGDIVPVLALHALLLPINVVHLTVIVAERWQARAKTTAQRNVPLTRPSIAKRDAL